MGMQTEVSGSVLCEVAGQFQDLKLSDHQACKKSAALLEELNHKSQSGMHLHPDLSISLAY